MATTTTTTSSRSGTGGSPWDKSFQGAASGNPGVGVAHGAGDARWRGGHGAVIADGREGEGAGGGARLWTVGHNPASPRPHPRPSVTLDQDQDPDPDPDQGQDQDQDQDPPQHPATQHAHAQQVQRLQRDLHAERRLVHELRGELRDARSACAAADALAAEREALGQAVRRLETDLRRSNVELGTRQAQALTERARAAALERELRAVRASLQRAERAAADRLTSVQAEAATSGAALRACRAELAEAYQLVAEMGGRLTQEQGRAESWKRQREVRTTALVFCFVCLLCFVLCVGCPVFVCVSCACLPACCVPPCACAHAMCVHAILVRAVAPFMLPRQAELLAQRQKLADQNTALQAELRVLALKCQQLETTVSHRPHSTASSCGDVRSQVEPSSPKVHQQSSETGLSGSTPDAHALQRQLSAATAELSRVLSSRCVTRAVGTM